MTEAFADPLSGAELPEPKAPRITNAREYELLSPGTEYTDPEGKPRTKNWSVRPGDIGRSDYERIPEGHEYIDPSGQKRTKPKYEGIDFTTQTLYDMALTDKERENALARGYGKERVKRGEGSGELYVDDDGKLRKPGRGISSAAGFLASSVAPVAGTTLGAIGAGLPGAFGGAVGGQMFNDMILGIAGVYDRSIGEEAAGLGVAGLSSTAGYGIGRGISAVAPAIKEGLQAGTAAIPRAAAHFLGADPEGVRVARGIAEKGEKPGQGILGKLGISETDKPVAPSTYLKEAPHVGLTAEVFDPAFNTMRRLRQGATKHYEDEAGDILKALGAEPSGNIGSPTASVSSRAAGEAVLAKIHGTMREADARMASAAENARTAATTDREARLAELRQAAERDRTAVQAAINSGFRDIQNGVDEAFRAAGVNANSGELWDRIGKMFQQQRSAIVRRHELWYQQADAAAEGMRPDVSGLPELARGMISELPGDFESKYPVGAKMLRSLGGEVDEEGNVVREPVQPTFGQLHNIRSYFRNNVNWYDLPSDFQNGTYKFLASRVDNALHDPNAPQQLQTAAQILDATDRSYSDNIRIYNDQRLKAVVKGLEGGEPADPKLLLDTLVKEGRSDLLGRVQEMVGPNLWSAVRAADRQEMLDASRTLVPGQIDGASFAREVLKRERNGMLRALHGPEISDRLMRQAQYLAMLDGKLDLAARPSDTITTLMQRAEASARAVEEEAKRDPLAVLQRETRETLRAQLRERSSDPLGFLNNLKLGASEAADKILDKEDLILAAAQRFKEDSPEFTALRQVWVKRILTGALDPAERLEKVSPEIQQLMLPGVTLPQMKQLAKEMSVILSSSGAREFTGTAGSMAAIARVENPWSHSGIPKPLAKVVSIGLTISTGGLLNQATARAMLGGYYGLVTRLATSPSTLRFLEKGLNGTKESREVARAMIRKIARIGGAVGAGAGEATYQAQ